MNRPLTAAAGNTVLRLVDFHVIEENSVASPDELLGHVAALEDEYRAQIASHLEASPGGVSAADYFRWAD